MAFLGSIFCGGGLVGASCLRMCLRVAIIGGSCLESLSRK